MTDFLNFYIGGAWVAPASQKRLNVVDPSTEQAFATISMGDASDVDRAVAAARRAFPGYSQTTIAYRMALLQQIVQAYRRRAERMGEIISREMGAPISFARTAHIGAGAAHFEKMIEVLSSFEFERQKGLSLVVREAIGVVGLITPWNWPLNQVASKVAAALAAGCTIVLKPSELSPLSAMAFAKVLDEAGVPPGVFNLVNGDGPTVGRSISAHPDIDMVSFTGSTAAGIDVAKTAADTVKRVHQELGGKSANILLDDANASEAVAKGVLACFRNAGQSCNAPTRMLVPQAMHEDALNIARQIAEDMRVGPAENPDTTLGPVVSQRQFEKIQELIQSGISEGATLAAGGLGRPDGLESGFFVKPTIFGNVKPDMRIAREEIFGPVLSIMPYDDLESAISEANDTEYGLAAYVQGRDMTKVRAVARQMRAGSVYLNYPAPDFGMPFGGYKQSGNGREYAEYGLEDFLEIKGIIGYGER